MQARGAHPLLASIRSPARGKVVTAAEAVRLIRAGDTVATGGFVGVGFAEEIAIALDELYLAREEAHLRAIGKPRNLTLVYAAGQGDGKERGLELTEIAPGVDLERDILARMDFRPVIKAPPRLMDPRIFREQPMGPRSALLTVPLEQRLTYDPQQNLFFVNFENFAVRSVEDVERIRAEVEARLGSVGRKMFAIVNYDNFDLAPEAMDAYGATVHDLVERHYSGVTRYTTSAFLRELERQVSG